MAYNQSFRSSPSGRQCFGKQIKSPKGKYFSIFLVPLTPCLSLLFSPQGKKALWCSAFPNSRPRMMLRPLLAVLLSHKEGEKGFNIHQHKCRKSVASRLRFSSGTCPTTQCCSSERHLSVSINMSAQSQFRLAERQTVLYDTSYPGRL